MKVLVLVDEHELGQELRNLLLSAGCSDVVLASELLDSAKSSTTESNFALAVVDSMVRPQWAVEALERLSHRSPMLRVVVLTDPSSELDWLDQVADLCRVEYTLKNTFARSLRSFLHPKES